MYHSTSQVRLIHVTGSLSVSHHLHSGDTRRVTLKGDVTVVYVGPSEPRPERNIKIPGRDPFNSFVTVSQAELW